MAVPADDAAPPPDNGELLSNKPGVVVRAGVAHGLLPGAPQGTRATSASFPEGLRFRLSGLWTLAAELDLEAPDFSRGEYGRAACNGCLVVRILHRSISMVRSPVFGSRYSFENVTSGS
jgi:hypothetical protein